MMTSHSTAAESLGKLINMIRIIISMEWDTRNQTDPVKKGKKKNAKVCQNINIKENI